MARIILGDRSGVYALGKRIDDAINEWITSIGGPDALEKRPADMLLLARLLQTTADTLEAYAATIMNDNAKPGKG